jgi:hypothetical protein
MSRVIRRIVSRVAIGRPAAQLGVRYVLESSLRPAAHSSVFTDL